MKFRITFSAVSVLFLFVSCASTGTSVKTEKNIPVDPLPVEISTVQQNLVESAEWALGKKRLVVNDRTFNLDCSGVVLAIYYKSGIDIQHYLSHYSGGGVQRIYAFMDDKQLLYYQPELAPGDMLFWDNTYDKNSDGLKNDALTHVGMVVSTDNKGNVHYIHHNYRLGIVLAKMNLLDPDNLELNSPMRAKGEESGHAPLWLSSHLLKQAARAYEIAE